MGITGTAKRRRGGRVGGRHQLRGGRRSRRHALVVVMTMASFAAPTEAQHQAPAPAQIQAPAPAQTQAPAPGQAPGQVQGPARPFELFLGVQETLTNNVDLESTDVRRGDLVTQLTPGFRLSLKGAHSSLTGQVLLPILIYARTGSENNTVEPFVDLLGLAELVDRFLFVEGAVNVSQQYLTPFGARSQSLANVTDNRYTSQTYRVTPYIRNSVGSDYSYELRDSNIWTKGNNNVVNDAYTNELTGYFRRDPRPFGWAVEVDRTSTKFADQQKQLQELARLRGIYQADVSLLLTAGAGYE